MVGICVPVINILIVDPNVTSKSFNFATKHNMPMFFVSAKDGTNVKEVSSISFNFVLIHIGFSKSSGHCCEDKREPTRGMDGRPSRPYVTVGVIIQLTLSSYKLGIVMSALAL